MLSAIVLLAIIEPSKHRQEGGRASDDSSQVQTESEQSGAPTVTPNDADFHFFGDSWAQWSMAGFAGFATALSVVGIGLLYTTWKATEKTASAAFDANETARAAIQSDQRPWLSCDDIHVGNVSLADDGIIRVILTVSSANQGKTPAIHVNAFGQIRRIPQPSVLAAEDDLDNFCASCKRTITLGRAIAIFPTRDRRLTAIARSEETPPAAYKRDSVRLFICVTYRPIHGDGIYHTGVLAHLDFAAGVPIPGQPLVPDNQGIITVREVGNIFSMS